MGHRSHWSQHSSREKVPKGVRLWIRAHPHPDKNTVLLEKSHQVDLGAWGRGRFVGGILAWSRFPRVLSGLCLCLDPLTLLWRAGDRLGAGDQLLRGPSNQVEQAGLAESRPVGLVPDLSWRLRVKKRTGPRQCGPIQKWPHILG